MQIDTLIADLRLGVRRLRHDALLTLTAVVSLAAGIGANTAIYTVARALLYGAQPGVSAADHLVDIGRTDGGHGFNPLSSRDYVDLRSRARTLQAAYAYNMFPQAVALRRDNADADRLFVTFVSSNYFDALGVVPIAGRLLQAADGEGPTAMPLAVLSDSAWARLFNRRPDVAGQSLTLNGQLVTIIGIAPPGFHGSGLRSTEAWLSIGALQTTDSAPLITSDAAWLMVGGRLRHGRSLSEADAEMTVIGRTLPSSGRTPTRGLLAVKASPVPGVETQNAGVAAHAVARRTREIGIRIALGATANAIGRLIVREGMSLIAIGVGIGLVLGAGAAQVVGGYLAGLPPLDPLAFGGAVTLFVAIGLAACSVPGRRAMRIAPTEALRQD